MNRMKQLIKEWEAGSRAEPTIAEVTVLLTRRNQARLRALEELFPGRSRAQLASEIFAAALDEVEEALPYVPGAKVVAEDEFGDPVYEDVGLTPKFESLTRKYLQSETES